MTPRQFIITSTLVAIFIGTSMAEDNLFTSDLSSWTLKSSPKASVSLDVATEDGKDALRVEVADIPDDPAKVSDVRISQPFGDLNADQAYQINFQAKSDKQGKIVIFIYPDNDSKRVLFRKDIMVDLDWQDYTILFTAKETTSRCVLGFSGLGRTNNRYFFRLISE